MTDLLTAALFFVGTHIGISSSPLRSELISRVGERFYRLLYSLVSIVALVWLIMAYRAAPLVPTAFGGGVLAGWLALLLMPAAFVLVVAAVLQPNPTAVGQSPDPDAPEPARGILRVTRHPLMWGIALWAAIHLLANPDLASLVFFGAIGGLALGGAWAQEQRLTREHRPGWGVFVQRTSFVPFVAIVEGRQQLVWSEVGWPRLAIALGLYVAFLLAHAWLFGVPPWPWAAPPLAG
jgi:uncharacterized membrane protein